MHRLRNRSRLLSARLGAVLTIKRGAVLVGVGVVVVVAVGLWFLTATSDRIVLVNFSGSDSPFIVFDGWRASCQNDEVYRSSPALLGNIVTNSTCVSEVSVFAKNNAMIFKTPIASWTPASTDVLTLQETGRLKVTLNAWVLHGHLDTFDSHVQITNDIYNDTRTGIVFSVNVHDVTASPAVLTAGCDNLATLKTAYPPVANQISVYYLQNITATDEAGDLTYPSGQWCGPVDPNVILMGYFAESTLAHELGHAMSLNHTDTFLEIPPQNVMYPATDYARDQLTIGQAFRMNVNPQSGLNTNSIRTGPARSCPDRPTLLQLKDCPLLSFD